MNEQLLTEEELLIRNTIRDYANSNLSERAARYDETGEFPWDNVNELADLGVLGLTIDEDFGGGGGTTRQLALVSEEIARVALYKASTKLPIKTKFIKRF